MSFINAILTKVENQTVAGQQGLNFFYPTVKVNVDQQMFGYPDSSKKKTLLLCSAQERN